MFFTTEGKQEETESNIDQFNDSYARDTTVDELKDVRPTCIRASDVANPLTITRSSKK